MTVGKKEPKPKGQLIKAVQFGTPHEMDVDEQSSSSTASTNSSSSSNSSNSSNSSGSFNSSNSSSSFNSSNSSSSFDSFDSSNLLSFNHVHETGVNYVDDTILIIDKLNEMVQTLTYTLANKALLNNELYLTMYLSVLKEEISRMKSDILKKAAESLQNSHNF